MKNRSIDPGPKSNPHRPKTVFQNATIVTAHKVVRGALVLQDGKITAITTQPPQAGPADRVIDCRGQYLLPGFFETHIHGFARYDCMYGRDDLQEDGPREYDEAIAHILAALPRIGITSTFLSAYAAPRPILERFLTEARHYASQPHPGHTRLLGLDLEGNFLKDPKYSGAQDPACVLAPTVKLFEELQNLSAGLIKKALIVPEWGEDAYALIRHMASRGLFPSVGHTGCTRDELLRAHTCGLAEVVHTGNGPMSQNFKAGGALDGIFELGPRLYGEIICDFKHVHPRWINTFINCFSLAHVVGVSDAGPLTGAGLAEGTVLRGCVVRDQALWVASKENALAGSLCPLNVQFNNVVNLFTSDRKAYFELKTPAPDSLDTALVKACRMYALNPAELFRQDREIGSLQKGKRGDFILGEIAGQPGAYRLTVKQVYIGGDQVV